MMRNLKNFAAAAALTTLCFTAFAGQALAENKDFDTGPTTNNNLFGIAKKKEAPIKVGGVPTTVTEIVAGKNQAPMLQSNSADLLQAAQARYLKIASQGGFPVVPGGTYKKGSKGSSVGVLNRRLYLEGYLRVEGTQGQFAELFTSATQEGVARFQRNHGLLATGKVDAPTLAELNVPAARRLQTIAANIPRLSTYELGIGNRYVVVNIPAQQIETVSGGRVVTRHNAIVGRPARPTPVVMTPLELVRFNPYWNAPVSIVEKDIIPKLQNGTKYLEDLNIKIFAKGNLTDEIDPSTLRFSQIVPDDYLFRQEPGPHNAMATAKIEFKSTFGIYLHDTPEQGMFNADNRFFSSGCIRVQKMPKLVEWVLNGQDGFGEAKIATMAETLERLDEPLQYPPQLRVAYLTAWPASGGTVAFRRDVYELDGSGFVVGQPMPVGEMSPEGKRFVLKPLPRQLPIDAAEAEGFGLFGSRTKSSAKTTSLFGSAKPQKASLTSTTALPKGKTKNIFGASVPTSDTEVSAKPKSPSKGLFDWAAYRKQQALDAKKAAKKPLVEKTTKPKELKATDNKVVATKDTKPAIKKLDCKPAANGKLAAGCPVPAKAASN